MNNPQPQADKPSWKGLSAAQLQTIGGSFVQTLPEMKLFWEPVMSSTPTVRGAVDAHLYAIDLLTHAQSISGCKAEYDRALTVVLYHLNNPELIEQIVNKLSTMAAEPMMPALIRSFVLWKGDAYGRIKLLATIACNTTQSAFARQDALRLLYELLMDTSDAELSMHLVAAVIRHQIEPLYTKLFWTMYATDASHNPETQCIGCHAARLLVKVPTAEMAQRIQRFLTTHPGLDFSLRHELEMTLESITRQDPQHPAHHIEIVRGPENYWELALDYERALRKQREAQEVLEKFTPQ